jgi:DNA-binding NarL/FixJ family response regulator
MMKDGRTHRSTSSSGSLAVRPRPKRIVLVDESPLYAAAWRALLEARYGGRIVFEAYQDPKEALPALGPDVSLLMVDLEISEFGGQKLFELSRERGVPLRRIVILSERPAEELHDLFPCDTCLAVVNKVEPQQQSAFLMILDSIVQRH